MYCKNCGETLRGEEQNCPKCGYEVEAPVKAKFFDGMDEVFYSARQDGESAQKTLKTAAKTGRDAGKALFAAFAAAVILVVALIIILVLSGNLQKLKEENAQLQGQLSAAQAKTQTEQEEAVTTAETIQQTEPVTEETASEEVVQTEGWTENLYGQWSGVTDQTDAICFYRFEKPASLYAEEGTGSVQVVKVEKTMQTEGWEVPDGGQWEVTERFDGTFTSAALSETLRKLCICRQNDPEHQDVYADMTFDLAEQSLSARGDLGGLLIKTDETQTVLPEGTFGSPDGQSFRLNGDGSYSLLNAFYNEIENGTVYGLAQKNENGSVQTYVTLESADSQVRVLVLENENAFYLDDIYYERNLQAEENGQIG